MINIQRVLAIISIFLLAACGGGGGDSTPSVTTPITPTASTVVSGLASKGIIAGGLVKLFALNADGSKGTQLGQDTTKSDGTYSINLGSYTGPVIVEASGTYTDEATGQPKTISAEAPLRAALGSTSGNVTLPVTPLTDLAVRQAGALTPDNITAANTLISSTFKVDIINTIPAAPTSEAFQSTTTTQAQKDYSMILAAVSQQMQTSGSDLATTLTTINSGISSAGMNAQTAATITSAATTFIANPNNQTTVTTIAGSTLETIGSTTLKLTLTLQGSSASTVKGIQVAITLPTGASVKADSTKNVLDGVITVTGSATNSSTVGNYTAATATSPATLLIGLMSSTTLSAGDVIILNYDLAAGSSVPAATAFTLSAPKLVATGGVAVSGASLALH